MQRVALLVSMLLALWAFDLHAQRLNRHYYHAQACLEGGNLECALSYIDSSLNAPPRNALIWIKKGEICFKQYDFVTAMQCFENANGMQKGIANYWMAKTYAQLNDAAMALQMLEQHFSQASKTYEATILLDTAFQPIENSILWKQFWLKDWYTDYERFLAEAEYHYNVGEKDLALELLNERIDGKKARHQLHALRGKIFLDFGTYKSAQADFEQALKSKKRDHEYLFLDAQALRGQKKYKQAIQNLTNAIEFSGGKPQYYLYRAQVLAEMEQISQALEDTKYYLTFYPDNLEANTLMAHYSVMAGKSIDGLLRLGKLIKENPDNAQNYYLRAKIYMETKKWSVALIDLNRALELNPSNGDFLLNRGICHINLGNRKEACSDWEVATKRGIFQAQEYTYKHCKGN